MLVTVEKLSKKFNYHQVVEQLTFQIKQNQIVALLGPNGSGKTTTLKMLAGILTPSNGKISFQGTKKIDRQLIGYLPQYPAFFPWMSAQEFLLFTAQLSKMDGKEIKEKISKTLTFVGLESSMKQRVGQFSGGMKQRLGLAQAIIHEPQFLILDEPVSALDPVGRRDVLSIIQQLKQKTTILFSTHVLHDAQQVCDEVMMLNKGRIQWKGALSTLINQGNETRFILQTEEKIAAWLQSLSYIHEYDLLDETKAELILKANMTHQQLLHDCMKEGLTITHFERKEQTLEEAYLEVIGE